ncbi:MAG: hypothetical protein AB7I33_08565 [Gemmatimonadales bacterium]
MTRPTIPPFLLTLCLLLAPLPLAAQLPARYQASPDTLIYTIDNPFCLYWVSGADTIGDPMHERSVETHLWSGAGGNLDVRIHQLSLDVGRRATTDTYTVTPAGRVVQVGHRPPAPRDRIDLLLRLPGTPIRVGSTWRDTVGGSSADSPWPDRYEVSLEYRVSRLFDTLGTSGVADIEARGLVNFALGFWKDSLAGTTGWMEVSGPVTEHFLFDTRQGRLLRRDWSMDLRGRGVSQAGPDTVPAGLRSEEVMVLDDSPRSRFLLQPLPGTDTSVTFSEGKGAILLHTVDREGDSLIASLSRNDGLVGIAEVTFDSGVPAGYSAAWADSIRLKRQEVTPGPDGLHLRRSDGADTTFVIPEGVWGIADYAMQELLVPILLAVPRDGQLRPFAVFRPTAAHWDTGTAQVINRAGAVLVILRWDSADKAQALLLTPEGDYLYGENSDPRDATRNPLNDRRMSELKAILDRLNQQ